MNKSYYNLSKIGKKWVFTAFAATSICISGYTFISYRNAYADNNKNIIVNGNYEEVALNAANSAKSYADIVSNIDKKWQLCPGGELLKDLNVQASSAATSASLSSSKVAQQTNEQSRSSLANDAISYANISSSTAIIATNSANSISSIANSMVSSAQYKIDIYKSYATYLNDNIKKYSNDVTTWNQDENLIKSPLLIRVNILKDKESSLASDASRAELNFSKFNSAVNSVSTNIIGKNRINSLNSGMTAVSNYGNAIGYFNQSYYDTTKSQASLAIQMTKNETVFHQISDSLNNNSKNNNDQNVSSSAFVFNATLSAYDTAKNLYAKMYNEFDIISDYANNTPFKNKVSSPKTGDSFDDKLNLLRAIEAGLQDNNYFFNESAKMDADFYPNLNMTIINARNNVGYMGKLASDFVNDIPIPSVNSLENDNMYTASSAYNSMNSMIQISSSMAKEFNSVKSSPEYKQIESYIDTVSNAATNVQSYADNISSIYDKFGNNDKSLNYLNSRIQTYVNFMRTEAAKIKQFGHMDTIENNSYNASYAISEAADASEINSQANKIANSISSYIESSNNSSTIRSTNSIATSSNTPSFNSVNSNNYLSNTGVNTSPMYTVNSSSSNTNINYSSYNSGSQSLSINDSISSSANSNVSSNDNILYNNVSNAIKSNTNSSNTNNIEKKSYLKAKNNLIKKINVNKIKASKYKHDYKASKNKVIKNKKLKQYRDTKYNISVLKKQLNNFNIKK